MLGTEMTVTAKSAIECPRNLIQTFNGHGLGYSLNAGGCAYGNNGRRELSEVVVEHERGHKRCLGVLGDKKKPELGAAENSKSL